jgi:NAD(P)-dependent dehydrogenase (short-subunit alcohol dehydrogenase family)
MRGCIVKGKIVLITGATSGIGKVTAIGLARKGATIVFTSRDEGRGKAARDEIARQSGSEAVEFMMCDLASFRSIRSFAESFKAGYDRLNVLVNNAGVWDFTRRESADGIENVFATNYLAPFLLTNLLLDLLKGSKPARILNVSSGLHRGTIHFNDIEFKKSFSGAAAYSQSKLALILFTRLLAEQLKGTGVTVNVLHPGFISTNLGRDAGFFFGSSFRFFGRSPEKGAETTMFLASAPEIETVTGEYFSNSKIARSSRQSHDMEMARRLWDLSVKYVGL